MRSRWDAYDDDADPVEISPQNFLPFWGLNVLNFVVAVDGLKLLSLSCGQSGLHFPMVHTWHGRAASFAIEEHT